MLLILLILFLLVSLSSFFEYEDGVKRILFFTCWCLCVAIAGFREVGVDKDSLVYLSLFNGIQVARVESSFYFISSCVKFCFGQEILFVLFIYAFIGVSLKFLAIRQLTDLWLLSCAIYISNFFILQDMTQIRAGVATGMLLLCIKPLYERNWKLFLIFAGIAIFFHNSAALILPLWFFSVKSFNKYIYGGLILLVYLLYIMGLTISEILSYIPIDYIQMKINDYKCFMTTGQTALNPFTGLPLLRLLVFILLAWQMEKIALVNKYIPLLFKVYVISIISFLLFIDVPVFAVRISEFLRIVEIILIPSLFYLFKNKKMGICFVIVFGVLFIFVNLFRAELIS